MSLLLVNVIVHCLLASKTQSVTALTDSGRLRRTLSLDFPPLFGTGCSGVISSTLLFTRLSGIAIFFFLDGLGELYEARSVVICRLVDFDGAVRHSVICCGRFREGCGVLNVLLGEGTSNAGERSAALVRSDRPVLAGLNENKEFVMFSCKMGANVPSELLKTLRHTNSASSSSANDTLAFPVIDSIKIRELLVEKKISRSLSKF